MSSLSYFKEVFAKIEEAKREAKQKSAALLSGVFKEFFEKYQGMKKVIIQGYTPSFNDGDPCEHSSMSGNGLYEMKESRWTSSGYRAYSDGVTEQYEGFFDLELTDDERDIVAFANDKFNGNEKEMNTDLGVIEQIADMVYDTNYVLYVTLEEDGSVNIDHEDYDCGY